MTEISIVINVFYQNPYHSSKGGSCVVNIFVYVNVFKVLRYALQSDQSPAGSAPNDTFFLCLVFKVLD